MKNTYIVKKDDKLISFYYGENKSIYMQKSNGNEVYETKVIDNVLDYFSVALSEKGQLYIFCQDTHKNVKLVLVSGEYFKTTTLFEQDFNIPHRAIFSPLFFNQNIGIIFNSLSSNSKENYISIKTLLENKKFTKTENIDIFSVGGNKLFEIQKLNDKDLIIAYEKREKEIQLGYKEVLNGKISPFISFHKTVHQIVDFSFLAFNNSIHFLYIIRNLFSSQVIYRKKDENGLSAPIVLYEGQKIRDCSIAFIENKLYCMYISNFNLFYSVSNDLGNTFSNVFKYKKTFSQNIIKADFINNCNNSKIYLNQVYVDYKNPLNIQFLPDISSECDFFNGRISRHSNQAIDEDLNSSFISDLSNQNINKVYIPDNKGFETNKTSNFNNSTTNSNRVLDYSKKGYKLVTNESDFMQQFNPKLFEDLIKSNNKQSILSNLNQSFKDIKQNSNFNDNSDENRNLELIKNKLKIANEQLQEKSSQLTKLNDKIYEKNKEKISLEIELRKKIEYLEAENKKLKQNTSLKEESEEKNVIQIEKNERTNKE